MVQSMTGFGRASSLFNSKKVSCEIRALNSKSLDLNLRIPSFYRELEPVFRKLIGDLLERGKIDFTLSIDSMGDMSTIRVNRDLASKYLNELKELGDENGQDTSDYMAIVMRMPDVLESSVEAITEVEKDWITSLVQQAINDLVAFRQKEGKELEEEFIMRIREIRTALQGIPQYEQERIRTVKERILAALEELNTGFDPSRLEQEMIFYLEKLDVSEEKMRLDNHLSYFEETLKSAASGKKLGFITQEIGREINTLGSKSNHAEMQKLVIGMKDALEKIKEQVLNTL